MGSLSFHRCLLLCTVFISVLVIETLGVDQTIDSTFNDFSLELIHYDSPRSPFYNGSETSGDRTLKAIRRSHNRLSYVRTVLLSRAASSSVPNYVSPIVPGAVDNDYLMTLTVGTPPVKRVVLADTGSGLNWVQCEPCKACFKQNYPLFDPRKSSTYRVLNCKTHLCEAIPRSFKSCSVGRGNHCLFNYSYGDNSVTQGELATETFTFETTTKKTKVRIPDVALGCGYYNKGVFHSVETGLAGLGNSKTSLVNQIGHRVCWRFSHCLVPHTLANASSVLSFGKAATVTAQGAVSVPYFPRVDTFYAVELSKIIVGGRKKSIDLVGKERGVILDTGTHLTILPTRVVKKMVYGVAAILGDGNVEDPTDTFVLCYPFRHSRIRSKLPSMKFRLGGRDVVVGPPNLFKRVSHNVTCLAVVPDDDVSILGNLFMANYKYGYDLKRHTVTIAPTHCTKHTA
ncbi:hypothetical protein H6P81_001278 [Aristolochia fimbriata]|uniref:Peptidase A1 domain-containing protein n=1 Tax=Aristolochia fimbriata TaxID=158543 RepID=A0AAV7F6F8_ARIFI|nr:hypothetical protein H6P81_001278 [Aristolochia fimbriata]